MNQALSTKREAILRLAEKYGAYNVRVFGSMSRGDDTNASDVDLLVSLESKRSLLDQVGFKQAVEELLGRKVDVVIEGGISPYLEERILSQAVPL